MGVIPSYRGLGLGRALVRRALAGFCQAGLHRAYLEVTAENAAAVQLYRNVGFRRAKTLYKAVDADRRTVGMARRWCGGRCGGSVRRWNEVAATCGGSIRLVPVSELPAPDQ